MRPGQIRGVVAGVLVLLSVAMAGCSSDAGGDEGDPVVTEATTELEQPVEDEQPEEPEGPTSCGAIALETGSVVTGDVLADCVIDYLAYAGSGASQMTSSVASSSMVWRMGDEYEAYAELDTGVRIVADGETAWVDFGDTGWVEADPNTPGMEVAFGIVEAWRQATAPEVTRSMIAAAPAWVVGELGGVQLPDGSSQELFELSSAEPFEWNGVAVDAMTLWMREPGRIVLQETTASAAGITETSTAYYTQWGEEVEIPYPTP